MCIRSECSNACVYFLTLLSVCACLLVCSLSPHAHTRPKSRPIQWLLTTKKKRPMKYAWQEKKLPALAHRNALPPSLSECKTLMAAVLDGAAAEPLDGAPRFAGGGLASSRLILDFTHEITGLRKSWAALPREKKKKNFFNPDLGNCARVCLRRKIWHKWWQVRS